SASKSVRPRQSVVVRRNPRRNSLSWLYMVPAALLSVLFHAGVVAGICALDVFFNNAQAQPPLEEGKTPLVLTVPPPPPQQETRPLAGSFDGRSASAATRAMLLREGSGTEASEAAVARGLQWLARVQSPDGAWKLDGPYPDKGSGNDVAGTAFGLLPFLAAGK